ncbi:MAG: hypothetical protein H0V82_10510 [Candidatus Protochlamydia sp.]|nr:hypothetical protein [Candidatus Protochlamydia sp.]
MNVGLDRYGYDGIKYWLETICELNESNKTIDLGLEYSKLFLIEVKKKSRLNLSISKLAEQAIGNFNRLFPEHQVEHQIYFPLLDTIENEYNLKFFQENLTNDALYLGANRVEIKEYNIFIPLTLYHLFFVYIALKNGNNKEKLPLLIDWIKMDDELSTLSQEDQINYSHTTDKMHLAISNFIAEKNLTIPLTWNDVKIIVHAICDELDIIDKNKLTLPNKSRKNLAYHFYRFCFYKNGNTTQFRELFLRALALEWGAPFDAVILYRAAELSADDIIKSEKEVHSLSFSPSFLAGIVFEGTPSGTCSYSYYNDLASKQLYALQLPPSKIEKYFFYPSLFKSHPLLPLVAKGEFSHPRMKFFIINDLEKISGVQGRIEQAKQLAAFVPTPKIQTISQYREKVIKVFQNHIDLIGNNEVI